MTRTLPLLLMTVAALVAVVPLTAHADSMDEALEVDRGVNPDQMALQRYDFAVKSADQALKRNLAQCDKMQPADRAECVREAQDLHDSGVAAASDVLHRPR